MKRWKFFRPEAVRKGPSSLGLLMEEAIRDSWDGRRAELEAEIARLGGESSREEAEGRNTKA